ncbi:MAG: hypothetical protein PHE04_05375 [Bacteroidales bacterium]|nr:hypothetical protein [Bacteroidales bacterium]
MKTVEQLLKYEAQCLDGRDQYRLFDFFTEEQLNSIGVIFKEEYKGTHKVIPLTREKVLEKLEGDVAFGFEKALDKRGISASWMYQVVKMWNWILEEGLETFDDHVQYGLPLFKATALKYGFDNPIGEDTGKESKYSSYDD